MQVKRTVFFGMMMLVVSILTHCADVPVVTLTPPSFSLYAVRYQNAWKDKALHLERADRQHWCVSYRDECSIQGSSDTLSGINCVIKTNATSEHYQIIFSCEDSETSGEMCKDTFGENGVIGVLSVMDEPDHLAEVLEGYDLEREHAVSKLDISTGEDCLNY